MTLVTDGMEKFLFGKKKSSFESHICRKEKNLNPSRDELYHVSKEPNPDRLQGQTPALNITRDDSWKEQRWVCPTKKVLFFLSEEW